MIKSVRHGQVKIHILPALTDNYIYVIEQDNPQELIVIDPAEAAPVIDFCTNNNARIKTILNTHHHHDHIGGNQQIKEKYNAEIIAPASEASRIAAIDRKVVQDDKFTLGSIEFHVFETSGHTTGHIVFYSPSHDFLFCGDVLFGMGCGRLFEGTAQEMWESLSKIKKLPPKTLIYCGHEYTLANAKFALHIDPNNKDLQKRAEYVKKERENGQITIPFTLADELATNPFLRAANARDFAQIRRQKDQF